MVVPEHDLIARTWVEAFNHNDVELFVSLFDPACEFRPAVIGGAQGAVYRRHAGLRAWRAAAFDGGRELQIGLSEIRSFDARRFAFEVWIGDRETQGVVAVRLDGHKVISAKGYFSTLDLLEQVGAIPKTAPASR